MNRIIVLGALLAAVVVVTGMTARAEEGDFSIKKFMKDAHGKDSYRTKVQAAIKAKDWDAASAAAKEWFAGAQAMIKAKPSKGEEESWKKMSTNYCKTVKGVLDACTAKDGKKAILWDYTNTYFTWPLLAANGGYAFKLKPDGTYDPADTGVNNAGAVKGAELLNKLIREKYMPEGSGYAEMEAAMAQGKVAMMINGPWSWDNLKKANIDFAVAKIPTVGGKKAAPFVGVLGAMLNKSTPNKDVAVEFIENYMLSTKGLKMINDDVPLGTPASKTLFAELKSDPKIQATMASAQDGSPMPNNPEMGRFWSAMVSALGNIMDGRQSPKEALDGAAKRILAK